MANSKFLRKMIRWFLITGFWLLVWQTAYLAIGKDVLLASPKAVAIRVMELSRTAAFWIVVANSLSRIMCGFLLALAVGALLAVLAHFVPVIRLLLHPIIGVVKSTPVASFIILALVFIRSTRLAVFIPFLMVFPLVWTNVIEGLEQVDQKLLEMAKIYRISRPARLRHIYLPAAAPYLIASCRVGVGFAWKSGIAAEVLGVTRDTIGGMLYNSKIYLLTLDQYAWTAVVIVLSILLERVVMLLIHLLTRKRRRRGEENGAHED